MAKPEVTKLRNIAIISHGGGGTTSLIENIFYTSKTIKKLGNTKDGTTLMSTEPEELKRGITITPHAGFLNWNEHQINILDAPGYVNFLEATRGVLQISDTAVLMISADSGVKAETERMWELAHECDIPIITFINKMDKDLANFSRSLDDLEKSFHIKTLPLTIPVGLGSSFKGIINLLDMTAWSVENEVCTKMEIPSEFSEDAKHYNQQLIETVIENNDQLLEKYFDGIMPTKEEIRVELKEAILTHRFLPVLCGSAVKHIGIKTLLDCIVNLTPNPLEKQKAKPMLAVNIEDHDQEIDTPFGEDAPMSAIVFKTTIDPFAGKLSYVRVVSGFLNGDSQIFNGTRQLKDNAGHLYKIQGNEMTRIDSLYTGEIGAIAKLTGTYTGDTLCDNKNPLHFHRVKYADPILTYAIEEDGKNDEKIALGLQKLSEEDPTLHFSLDSSSNEMILSGMGQTHIEVALEKLKRKFGVEANLKAPKIPYKETLIKNKYVQGKIKKQNGGHGQFGDCWIEVEPQQKGFGFEFVNKIVGGAIPRQFIPSVEKGIVEAMTKGALGGFPVTDVKVTLNDGSFHSVDSSDFAFVQAGIAAFQEAMKDNSILLEPIMDMEITVPEENIGEVIKDMNSRRGQITGVNPKTTSQIISVKVPMGEVLEYGNILHSLTSGLGLYTMHLESYQEVSGHQCRQILKKEK